MADAARQQLLQITDRDHATAGIPELL